MRLLVRGLDNGLKWFVIIVMGANVINVLWQVFTRFVMGNPSSWTEELARYLLIWVSLLGAAYTHRIKGHIAIDVVANKFTGKARHYSRMFIQLCVFLFALLAMVIGGLHIVNLTLSLGQVSAALQVKMGYVYAVIPLSGILIMFYAGLYCLNHVRALFWDKGPIIDEIEETLTTAE